MRGKNRRWKKPLLGALSSGVTQPRGCKLGEAETPSYREAVSKAARCWDAGRGDTKGQSRFRPKGLGH